MNTTTINLGRPAGAFGLFEGRSLFDWLFAVVVLSAGAYAFSRYAGSMDVYEKAILIGVLPVTIALGWFWGPLRVLTLGVALATLYAISLYNRHTDNFGADLAQGENVFMLKYFLSSQSAILWMSVLFFHEHDLLLDRIRGPQCRQRRSAHRLRAGMDGSVHGPHRHDGEMV